MHAGVDCGCRIELVLEGGLSGSIAQYRGRHRWLVDFTTDVDSRVLGMRILAALAAGLAVGTVVVESVFAGLLVLLPDSALRIETAAGGPLIWPLMFVPALVWICGGAACGAMASAVSGRSWTGLLGGILMAVPAFVIVNLTTPGQPMAMLAALLPFSGAMAGAAFAARILRADATVSAPDQRV